MSSIRTDYNHTIRACYIGYITQAIVNNFAPLLFLTFAADYGLTLDKITLITTVNFAVQLSVDLLSAKFIDRIGYRPSVLIAHVTVALGLIGLSVLPLLFPDRAYAMIMLSVVLYAIGGGIIEVLISPIVEACPTERKEAVMSLLHSFYCWGHMAVVIVSTVFFAIFGVSAWHIMAVLWALVPLANIIYFCFVPIYPIVSEDEKLSLGGLFAQPVFWIVFMLMICSGASEQGMSQWASAFAESALGVSKTIGDLAGPTAFAFCMGLSRFIYGKYDSKLPLRPAMLGSAVLCMLCYIIAEYSPYPIFALVGCALCGFSVGILWPGTFSIAAAAIPGGGTAMYALLALAGDIGCGSGPTLVGMVSAARGGALRDGLIFAIIFPILMFLGLLLLGRVGKRGAK